MKYDKYKSQKLLFCFSVYILVIYLIISYTGELSHTYIMHDDFEFLADYPSQITEIHETPFEKTLSEGRWINYGFSFITKHMSILSSLILFIIFYSLFCFYVSTCFASMNIIVSITCALALFFNPEFAYLSLWPCALFCSILISIIYIYNLKNKTHKKIYISYFVSIFLLSMAYQPAGYYIFIIASLFLINKKSKLKENTIVVLKMFLIFILANSVSCLSIYSLNYLIHNCFGLQIASWRAPHPAQNAHDFICNFYDAFLDFLNFTTNKTYAYGMMILLITSVFSNKTLHYKISIFVPVVFIVVFNLIFCAFYGVNMPYRSNCYFWIWIVLAITLCCEKYITLASMMYFIIFGSSIWYGVYSFHSDHAKAMDELANELKTKNIIHIYAYYDENAKSEIEEIDDIWCQPLFAEYLYKQHNIVVTFFNEKQKNELKDKYILPLKIKQHPSGSNVDFMCRKP